MADRFGGGTPCLAQSPSEKVYPTRSEFRDRIGRVNASSPSFGRDGSPCGLVVMITSAFKCRMLVPAPRRLHCPPHSSPQTLHVKFDIATTLGMCFHAPPPPPRATR